MWFMCRRNWQKLGRDYQRENIGIVAISSNDVKNYPQDSPVRLKGHGGGIRADLSLLL